MSSENRNDSAPSADAPQGEKALPDKRKQSAPKIGKALFGAGVALATVASAGAGFYQAVGGDEVGAIVASLAAPGGKAGGKAGDDKAGKGGAASGGPLAPTYVELPETAYALTGAGQPQYLLTRIVLKPALEMQGPLRNRLPEIEAAFQNFIRELRAEDLEGASGLYRLRRGCLHRARLIAGADAVEDVFITDIIVR